MKLIIAHILTTFITTIMLIYAPTNPLYAQNEPEKSILLSVKPVPDDFFADSENDQGIDKEKDNSNELIVTGLINSPSFSVKSINNMALYDANGNNITITVDKSSIYSEFEGGDINSARILFRASPKTTEKGAFRFVWQNNISSKNKETDKIVIYKSKKDLYRKFEWQEQPQNSDTANYAATLEVIVDDKADTYYLWYLFPMALIFMMLFIRRMLSR